MPRRGEGVFIISERLLHTRFQNKSVAVAETDITLTMWNVLYTLCFQMTVDIGATIFKCTHAIYTPPYVRLRRRFKRNYNSYIHNNTQRRCCRSYTYYYIICISAKHKSDRGTLKRYLKFVNDSGRGEINKITHVLYMYFIICTQVRIHLYTIYSVYSHTYTYYTLNLRHNNTCISIQIICSKHQIRSLNCLPCSRGKFSQRT